MLEMSCELFSNRKNIFSKISSKFSSFLKRLILRFKPIGKVSVFQMEKKIIFRYLLT
jgi:hypothetical protein